MTIKNEQRRCKRYAFIFDYNAELQQIWRENLAATPSDVLCESCNDGSGSSKDVKVRVFIGAAGDRSNERVKFCYICKNNGFPHEAIDFRKINSGRIKNDGSYEFRRYEVLNYFTGGKHEHKHRRRSPAAERRRSIAWCGSRNTIGDHLVI